MPWFWSTPTLTPPQHHVLYPPISSTHPSDPSTSTPTPNSTPTDTPSTLPTLPPNTLSTPRGRAQATLAFQGLALSLAITLLTRSRIRRRAAARAPARLPPHDAGMARWRAAQIRDVAAAERAVAAQAREERLDGEIVGPATGRQGRDGQSAGPGAANGNTKGEADGNAKGKGRAEKSNDGADSYLLAAEALGLATVNVAAWAFFAAGGLAWWLNVSEAADLKVYVRRGKGLGVREGETAAADEASMEELLAGVLSQAEGRMQEVVQEAERRTGRRLGEELAKEEGGA